MTKPINLMQHFGTRYRISFDPAYDPKHRPISKLDESMMEVRCRFGTIYPFCERTLAVMVDYHPKIAAIISRIPGVEIIRMATTNERFGSRWRCLTRLRRS